MLKIVLVMAGAATTAGAGSLLGSFSYENLDSDYNIGTGQLLTTADALSTGSVSRLVAPAATAEFAAGSASMVLDLTVSNIVAGSADGLGTVTLTDLTGDTVTADVDGEFTFVPIVGSTGVLFFDGVLTNVFFNDNSGDGLFDGNAVAFDTDFSAFGSEPFVGAIQRLQVTDVNFFETSWGNRLSEVDGQIIPAPAGVAMLGLGALVAGRRRRA